MMNSKKGYGMQQDARFLTSAADAVAGLRRRYGLFTIHVLMVLTVVLLLTLVLAAAEAVLPADRSLSALEASSPVLGAENSFPHPPPR
jgi:hypothetical protein